MSETTFERLDQAKEYIKERIQLSDLVSRHTKLIKEPRGFKCLCPLPGHREKTASFHIDIKKNLFYCYGCSKGGDIFEFVSLVEGLSFMDALKDFADKVNVTLPSPKGFKPEQSSGIKESIALMDRACAFFSKNLVDDSSLEAQKALNYLKERGIDDEHIVQFSLGWASSKKDAITRNLKSPEDRSYAKKCGLVSEYNNNAYDFFINRLMIPIRDVRGRVLAFSGRSLEPVTSKNPKYKNSPETNIFKKKWVLYGLGESLPIVRQKDYVCVVEGFFDQWALLARQIPSVAVMGTALTEDHAKTLNKYCSEVILFLDKDDAGTKAVIRSLPMLVAEGLDTKVFVAPQGKDPDEWLKNQKNLDEEALETQLRSATEGLQWWAEYKIAEAEKLGLNSLQIMNSLAEIWAITKTEAHRRVLAHVLSAAGGLSADQFYSSMNSMVRNAKSPSREGYSQRAPEQQVQAVKRLDPLAVELFETWLSGWNVLTPKSHEAWDRYEKLFSRTALSSLIAELSAKYSRQHAKLSLAEVGQLLKDFDLIDESSRARFTRAIFDADSRVIDAQKLEKGFQELCILAEGRMIDSEIAQIRQKIKKLPENSSETEQLLHKINELLQERNNHLEKAAKGTSVGSL